MFLYIITAPFYWTRPIAFENKKLDSLKDNYCSRASLQKHACLHPDRAFLKFRALNSVDQRKLSSSETWIVGFGGCKVVKYFVGILPVVVLLVDVWLNAFLGQIRISSSLSLFWQEHTLTKRIKCVAILSSDMEEKETQDVLPMLWIKSLNNWLPNVRNPWQKCLAFKYSRCIEIIWFESSNWIYFGFKTSP